MPTCPTWRIEPAGPLRGDVRISGSKNAVTKLMVASLLSPDPGRVGNAPHLGDVGITADMLRSIGAAVDVDPAAGTVTVDPARITDCRIPVSYSGLNRVPILMTGPLLHRIGEAFVPFVGGDRIGSRPVDYHVDALRQLGAEIEVTEQGLEAKASQLHGAHIRLPFPSVGATETVLLTAVLADGRTNLENAAIEPEVVELALFLQRMGARIELQPDRTFVIEGVSHLTGAHQRIGGDRIEAFSYLVAGLATGGHVRVLGCSQDRLVTAISTLQRMGAEFQIDDDGIAARVGPGGLRPAVVQTDTHPGFMTDWQPGLAVLCTQARGLSVVHETVFEDRLGYVEALRAMHAEVELFDQCLVGQPCRFEETGFLHAALVRGASELQGAEITMPDIRAAFAYVIAAATAHGPSTLHGVHHLERG
ncbi:MAG: UDP-N-acetylglucosamine 1-carboxyvinyltransferase, partial [Acidimicrobiales bacterium]